MIARMAHRLRLADLIAALSVVADLGFGLPSQHAMRSCVVATAGARRLGLPEEDVRDAFYAALLIHVGCAALSYEAATALGDEFALGQASSLRTWPDPGADGRDRRHAPGAARRLRITTEAAGVGELPSPPAGIGAAADAFQAMTQAPAAPRGHEAWRLAGGGPAPATPRAGRLDADAAAAVLDAAGLRP